MFGIQSVPVTLVRVLGGKGRCQLARSCASLSVPVVASDFNKTMIYLVILALHSLHWAVPICLPGSQCLVPPFTSLPPQTQLCLLSENHPPPLATPGQALLGTHLFMAILLCYKTECVLCCSPLEIPRPLRPRTCFSPLQAGPLNSAVHPH